MNSQQLNKLIRKGRFRSTVTQIPEGTPATFRLLCGESDRIECGVVIHDEFSDSEPSEPFTSESHAGSRPVTRKPLRDEFCHNCEASLTETDYDAGRCTQCDEPIRKENDNGGWSYQ